MSPPRLKRPVRDGALWVLKAFRSLGILVKVLKPLDGESSSSDD